MHFKSPDSRRKIVGEIKNQLIDAIFPAADDLPQLALARIQAAWPQIAGTLYRHSQPLRIQGNRLIVRIEKDVYAQDFLLLKADILKRLSNLNIGSARLTQLRVEKGRLDWKPDSRSTGNPDDREVKADRVSAEKRPPEEMDAGMREFLDGLRQIK